MPSRVDLHTHTTASDGTLEPAALLEKAAELSVRFLGIADHDSTAGYEAVLPLASKFPGVELIPAIEINAEGEGACHLLGYYVDFKSPAFQKELAAYREARHLRVRAMIDKLGSLGIAIDYERVRALAQGGSIGRPHIADALIEKGVVTSRQKAFDRFLKKDGPAYVPGESPSAGEAIRLIRSAGGIPVLAHPWYYTNDDLIGGLVAQGLMGIEVYYPEHSRALVKRYLEFAQTYKLVATGGSDFHGPRTGRTALACVDVPESAVEDLKKAKNRV
jgi:predicted metal-dependent phosphoesterase TrpH